MNKNILKTFATVALVVQIALPVWWGAVFASFATFWVEGIIEGGILGREIVIGVDQIGNSIIGHCFLTNPCSFPTLLWGLFSVYGVAAVIVAVWSLFFNKTSDQGSGYTKKGIVFLIINLITIILSVVFVSVNGGIFPKL
ncbi:hypothetical protein HYZ82_02890 [Candidatus Nomurabacteria bacterium]|nr:hypothetical protein [Candidatus Nomurabacteria bacterium]